MAFCEEARSKVEETPPQMISRLERDGSCVDIDGAGVEIQKFVKQTGFILQGLCMTR